MRLMTILAVVTLVATGAGCGKKNEKARAGATLLTKWRELTRFACKCTEFSCARTACLEFEKLSKETANTTVGRKHRKEIDAQISNVIRCIYNQQVSPNLDCQKIPQRRRPGT